MAFYRTGDSTGGAPCNATSGTASSRCDFETATGVISFGPGETSKTITVPIIDDSYPEGQESFRILLSNIVGASFGHQIKLISSSLTTTPWAAQSIDQAGYFVRQNYIDFLNREPDAAGLAHWTNEITQCGSDAQCIEIKRLTSRPPFIFN